MDDTPYLNNRKLRIFISSTFKDMNAERDYLVNKIFPKVKEECLKRNVEFLPLDLRWGITEEEAKQGHVIATCLEEVDNCRPFFIGLLGERYGWSPRKDDLGRLAPTLLQHYAWLEKDLEDGVSITEMEMQYAALRNSDIKYANFYLRKPDMKVADEFKEPAGSAAAIKLDKLKKKILNQPKYPVSEYNSPADLGNKVYEDVIKMIDEEFPRKLADGDLFERRRHEFNIARLTASYVADPNLMKVVNEWLLSKSRFLVITGDEGTGKSSLMCYYLEAFRKQNPNVKTIYHDQGVAGRTNSSNPLVVNMIDRINDEIELLFGWKKNEKIETMGCLFSFIGFIFKGIWMMMKANVKQAVGNQDNAASDFSNEFAASVNDLIYGRSVKLTAKLAKKLSKHSQELLYIFIDNVDMMPDNEQNIAWFLRLLPENVRFVLTARKHSIAETTIRRELSGVAVEVERFNADMSVQYITKYLARYSKHLDSKQIAVLMQGFFVQVPQLLTLVLDQIITFGSFEQLDQRINQFVTLKDKGALALFSVQNIINEFEGVFERNPAQLALGAISLSNKGLKEEEIQEILGLRPIEWSMVRSHILPLCSCTENKYSIHEKAFTDAVSQLLPPVTVQQITAQMIRYFEKLLDYKNRKTHHDVLGQLDTNKILDDTYRNQRQAEELPNLYIRLQRWYPLFNFVSYILNDIFFTAPERNRYWRALYDNGYRMQNITQTYSPSFTPNNEQIRNFYDHLNNTATTLNNATDKNWILKRMQQDSEARKYEGDNELICCQKIDTLFLQGKYQEVIETVSTLTIRNPYLMAKMNLFRSSSYRNLGMLNEALEAAWKGIEFARTQNGDTEVVAEAIIYYCSICADTGQKEFTEKARKMLTEIYDFQIQQGLEKETTFIMLNTFGKISMIAGDYPGALKFFRDALASTQIVYGKEAYISFVLQTNLGLAQLNTGSPEEAEKNLLQGLEGMMKQKGMSNPDLIEPMVKYAMLLKNKKSYADSLSYLGIVDNLFAASPYANADYHQFVRKQMAEMRNAVQELEVP